VPVRYLTWLRRRAQASATLPSGSEPGNFVHPAFSIISPIQVASA